MTETASVRTVTLSNGLTLTFLDQTNRYFGDFHRVLLVVEVGGDIGSFAVPDEMKSAALEMNDDVLYRRDLERMGVPTERLAATIEELIDSFLASAKDYLGKPEMPEQLLKKKFADKGRPRRARLSSALHGKQ